MEVTLATELIGKLLAVWACSELESHREAPGFREELSRVEAGLRERYADLEPARIPLLAPARRLYRAVGMDPTRHRPSSEALLRRILLGKGLYRLDPVVDTGNLFSLSHGMPLGLYDRDQIEGPVQLRLGRTGESFAGIRKGPVNVAGRLCLADARGPFGSPSSDSARCRIREDTERLLWLLYAPGDAAPTELLAAGNALAAAFQHWHGGRTEPVRLLPDPA